MLDSTEILDISASTWSVGPNLPHSVKEAVSVVLDDSIYIAGGNNGFDRSELIKYDSTNGWQIVSQSLLVPRTLSAGTLVYPSSVGC